MPCPLNKNIFESRSPHRYRRYLTGECFDQLGYKLVSAFSLDTHCIADNSGISSELLFYFPAELHRILCLSSDYITADLRLQRAWRIQRHQPTLIKDTYSVAALSLLHDVRRKDNCNTLAIAQ